MSHDAGQMEPPTPHVAPTIHCACRGAYLTQAFTYSTRPVGETAFANGNAVYERFFDSCKSCGHWFGRHAMALEGLYSGAYVDTTYGTDLGTTFERIIAIPHEKSDNFGRCNRIQDFVSNHLPEGERRLLDIGAGTGVFPHAMKSLGWSCTALDPDPRACAHLRERVGVAVIQGDFSSLDTTSIGPFELITLNKVVEHVEDPISMLTSAGSILSHNGLLYVEVPDGSAAAQLGKDREEFFVEHLHAFSLASLALTIERAGLCCLVVERLIEPSGKRTIFAFASKSDR
jgi:SAM-dependent methyltransferase